MRRQFKVVGKIDENTKVLGTTYGQVKEVIHAGFQQEFQKLEASKAQMERSDVRPTVMRHDEFVRVVGLSKVSAHSLLRQIEEGQSMYAFQLVEDQLKASISGSGEAVRAFRRVGGAIVRGVREGWRAAKGQATPANILDTPSRLIPNGAYDVSVSGGHLILKDRGATQEPTRTTANIHRRRVGDKDYSR
jgi:hypothetical protein